MRLLSVSMTNMWSAWMVLAGWNCATGNSWESTSLYTRTLHRWMISSDHMAMDLHSNCIAPHKMISPLSDSEPQLHRRHLKAMPWPLTPLLHNPHSPLSGPEPQLQCRHLTEMPWPLTPLLHRPRYPPSLQLQLHLHCHPLHCRALVTSHLVHQMVPLRMPLPRLMVLAVMIPVWPHTLNCIPLMCPECWHGCRPTTTQARGSSLPYPPPFCRDAHRDSPTPSQISPH